MTAREIREIRFEDLLAWATRHGDDRSWRRILRQIEGGFFLRQAEHYGDFTATLRDLEAHLLPHLARSEDMERWLRWAQTAIHLRGLVDNLGAEALWPALAAGGHLPLARNLASQIPDPLRRARVLGEITHVVSRQGRDFGELLDQIRADLDEASEPADDLDLDAWITTLSVLGRHHGVALRQCFSEWIAHLPPDPTSRADEIHLAVVGCFFTRGLTGDADLWEFLRRVREPREPPEEAVVAVRRGSSAEVVRILGRVAGVAGKTPLWRWRFALPLLAARAADGGDPVEIWALAKSSLGSLPPVSEPLLDAGRGFWGLLPLRGVEAVARQWNDAASAGAWYTAVLEGRRGDSFPVLAQRALDALDRMPPGPRQLHWSLRWLAATPGWDRARRPGRVATVGHHLTRLRFAVQAADLAVYLDLVADCFPRSLPQQVGAVLWAPDTSPEILLGLIRHARSARLLDQLLERAEDNAAAVADRSAEGFSLRARVLIALGERRCLEESGVDPETVARRLLPAERDEWWSTLSRARSAAGLQDRALRACRKIRDRALALSVRLEVAAVTETPTLTLAELYEAVGRSEVEEELLCLEAVLEAAGRWPAEEPDAGQELEEVGPRRRTMAWIDLAVQDLYHESVMVGASQQDPLGIARRLAERLGVVPSQRWLLALTPELVRVASLLEAERCVVELEEALLRIADMEDGPWELREEALVKLLTRAPKQLSAISPRRRRAWTKRLLRLPDPVSRGLLRQRWHRVFPWLAAAEACSDDRWRRKSLAWWRRRWPWLDDRQAAVVEASLTGGAPLDDEAVWRALAVRSAVLAPEGIETCLARLRETPERHLLVLQLVTSGWPGPEVGEALLPWLPDRDGWRSRGELARCLWKTGEEAEARFVDAVRDLVAGGSLDPCDPEWMVVRWWCWKLGRRLLPRWVEIVHQVLLLGHPSRAAHALRLFAGAWVEPNLGEDPGEGAADRLERARRMVDAARSLGGGA
jgi:hypothetical protein